MSAWRLAAGLLLAATLAPAPAGARENAVPSCYAASGIGIPAPPSPRAFFLFLDQTTPFEPRLLGTIAENMRRHLRPGTSFVIGTFSAFQPGNYAAILTSGTIELPVPDAMRSSLPTNRLHGLDLCLRQQVAFAVHLAQATFAGAISGGAVGYSRSEIMASLRQLSGRVAATPARDRIVLIGSDMLEYSTATSFYRNRGLRLIDPAAELRLAVQQRLIGNFAGARIYIVGAGLLPPGPGAPERDLRALAALESFWTAWVTRSNGRVAGFGRPDLVTPIP